MKTGEKVGLWLLVLVALFYTGMICYHIAHDRGYNQGAFHAKLYYEATGEFPAKQWLHGNEGKHYHTIEDILERLKPITSEK